MDELEALLLPARGRRVCALGRGEGAQVRPQAGPFGNRQRLAVYDEDVRVVAAGSRSTSSLQNAPTFAVPGGFGMTSQSRARVTATYRRRRASARAGFSSAAARASQPGGWQPLRKPTATRLSSQSGITSAPGRDRKQAEKDLEDDEAENADSEDEFKTSEEVLDAIITLDDLHRDKKISDEAYHKRRAELKESLKGKM